VVAMALRVSSAGAQMKRVYRAVRFTDEEKAKGLNQIDLTARLGDLEGEYIVPELKRIYGWWTPTWEAVMDFAGKGYDIDLGQKYWAVVQYLTYYKSEELERELLSIQDAKASDFLRLEWSTSDVYFPEGEAYRELT